MEYNLEPFLNQLVSVEAKGQEIVIEIMVGEGKVFQFKVEYPFMHRRIDFGCLHRGPWYAMYKTSSDHNRLELLLYQNLSEKDSPKHLLILKCLNPNAYPKPITVTWK